MAATSWPTRPRQGHVRSGARHHRSPRPHGRALQSHPEGLLDFRRFGGTLYQRTAFAGATTGQQLLYALDEQVRRHEADGKVKKYEGWEFLSAIIDSKGQARGITASTSAPWS